MYRFMLNIFQKAASNLTLPESPDTVEKAASYADFVSTESEEKTIPRMICVQQLLYGWKQRRIMCIHLVGRTRVQSCINVPYFAKHLSNAASN